MDPVLLFYGGRLQTVAGGIYNCNKVRRPKTSVNMNEGTLEFLPEHTDIGSVLLFLLFVAGVHIFVLHFGGLGFISTPRLPSSLLRTLLSFWLAGLLVSKIVYSSFSFNVLFVLYCIVFSL